MKNYEEYFQTVQKNVKQLMESEPTTIDSDKTLIWFYWMKHDLGLSNPFLGKLSIGRFLKCTNPESITRAGRKIRQENPQFQSQSQDKKDFAQANFEFYRKEVKNEH